MPQAIDKIADLPGAQRILANHLAEPPVAFAGHLFQRIRVEINHPIAPAVGGFRLAGVQLIGVHGDDRVDRSHVLAAPIAKTLGAELDRADTKGFMGVRFKGVAGDMGMI